MTIKEDHFATNRILECRLIFVYVAILINILMSTIIASCHEKLLNSWGLQTLFIEECAYVACTQAQIRVFITNIPIVSKSFENHTFRLICIIATHHPGAFVKRWIGWYDRAEEIFNTRDVFHFEVMCLILELYHFHFILSYLLISLIFETILE